MNERIRELAEQAGVKLSPFQFSGIPVKYEITESNLENLAELIVRDCMEHALEIGRLNPGPQTEMTCRSVSDRISIKMLGVYPKAGPIKAETV